MPSPDASVSALVLDSTTLLLLCGSLLPLRRGRRVAERLDYVLVDGTRNTNALQR